tara:strand:- start:421 stop:705 length:285 start_codon:yes stop_codon:yes gene_type:complete
MMSKQQLFNLFSGITIMMLGWKSYDQQKQINMYSSMSTDIYRQVNDNSLILDSIMEQVPPEVEKISRRVAKEEGIKLFKEFADNFKKLSEEGKE